MPSKQPDGLYEVVTRRPDGHETVIRTVAGTEAAAVDKVEADHEVPRDRVSRHRRPGRLNLRWVHVKVTGCRAFCFSFSGCRIQGRVRYSSVRSIASPAWTRCRGRGGRHAARPAPRDPFSSRAVRTWSVRVPR